jgi:hypothetical protein
MLMIVRKTHPLLRAFPLAVMALATLLIAFAFAMASAGHANDSDLPSAPGLSASHAAPGQTR